MKKTTRAAAESAWPANRGPRLSAGMILARPTAGGWRFLLLRAYRNWDFPKGLVATGEAPLEAARREVAEETGIRDVALAWGEDYYETPPYAGGKVARFYLGRTATERVVPGINPQLGGPEHHEHRWLTFAAARRLLGPRLQAALDWAERRVASGQRPAVTDPAR